MGNFGNPKSAQARILRRVVLVLSATIDQVTAIISLHNEISGDTVGHDVRLSFMPALNDNDRELRASARAQWYSICLACAKDLDSFPNSVILIIMIMITGHTMHLSWQTVCLACMKS